MSLRLGFAMVAVAASACNQTFGILPTEVRPDAPAADEDVDGVSDITDNCVAIANPSQSDEDRDGFGDHCDNCPLVENLTQDHIGDSDEVGDACDPRPELAGDCLIVLDTFADPEAFDTRWTMYTFDNNTTITKQAGYLAIIPSTMNTSALVALDTNGVAMSERFDVQVSARVDIERGGFFAVSNADDPQTGYSCGLELAYVSVGWRASSQSASVGSFMSSDPVGNSVLLRLRSPSVVAGETALLCRADHGVAVGVLESSILGVALNLPNGGPGIRLSGDPAEVEAIALYHFQPGGCPDPSFR